MKDFILKYVKKDKKENIFHSSSYGRAQNGTVMGAASTETFHDRRQIDQHRKVIQKYGDSRIASSGAMNGPHAKPYVPPKSKSPTSPRPTRPKY